jgi:hypothetical protein
MFGAMCVGMGVVCLIPMRNGAFYTDGGRWLRMRKSETRKIEQAVWNITQYAAIHNNLANVDESQIEILKNCDDLRMKYMGHYYAYTYYKDNEKQEEAETEKQSAFHLKGKVSKQFFTLFPFE